PAQHVDIAGPDGATVGDGILVGEVPDLLREDPAGATDAAVEHGARGEEMNLVELEVSAQGAPQVQVRCDVEFTGDAPQHPRRGVQVRLLERVSDGPRGRLCRE